MTTQAPLFPGQVVDSSSGVRSGSFYQVIVIHLKKHYEAMFTFSVIDTLSRSMADIQYPIRGMCHKPIDRSVFCTHRYAKQTINFSEFGQWIRT